ncbi:flippase-like domain-containing protein [Candidatus Berkelbacteria bacterium]|nr:flippase-like domain-containing protein [Candidatus Berkelbacteria bacterium]
MPSSNFLRIVKQVLRVAIPIAVGAFLLWQIYQNWQQIAPQIARANWIFLIAAFFVNLALYPLWLLGWHIILRSLGQNIQFPTSFRIGVLANFGKYIPGVVWQYLGRIELAYQAGVPRPLALASLVYEVLIYLIAGGVWALAVLSTRAVIAGLIGAVVLWSLLPKLFGVLRRRIAQLKDLPETVIPVQSVIVILVVNLADFFVTGLAIWLILKSFGVAALEPLQLTAIYALAWIIGYLSFLAPGGIGIADVTLAGLLTPHLGIGLASLVAVILRIIIFGNELLLGFIMLKLWRKQR